MQKKLFKKYTAAGVTDVGCVRQHNEDNILIDEELCLLLIADGMGGHQGGEIASLEAIKIIQKILLLQQRTTTNSSGLFRLFNKIEPESSVIEEKKQSLKNALHEANHHIYQLNVERNCPSGTGMGTTIAGCWLVTTDMMLVFHIGDSRIYRFRNNTLEALSKDHSVLQEWHNNGCIGEKPKSNIIVNAVGPYPETKPEIKVVLIKNTDTFLICSDGLTDMVEDSYIEKNLQGVRVEQIVTYCQNLLQSALKQGGKDNVSIILMTQG